MKAAWYERQGSPTDVLTVGEIEVPLPGLNEVRIRVAASGVNPGDVKKRHDTFGVGMPFPRVIPHSDGAGVIDSVGEQVPTARVGERVWCFGAQSYRPFGFLPRWVDLPLNVLASWSYELTSAERIERSQPVSCVRRTSGARRYLPNVDRRKRAGPEC